MTALDRAARFEGQAVHDVPSAGRLSEVLLREGFMSEQTHPGGSTGSKFVEEFKVMLALAAYLYICFGAVILFKSAVLREAGIHSEIWGIAAIKALILAKFLLLGRMLHVGTRFRDKPLIWPTLYHALMFLIVLLVLTALEELIVGFIHARAIADSLNHVGGDLHLSFNLPRRAQRIVTVPLWGAPQAGNLAAWH
jgi:hypothetical protein